MRKCYFTCSIPTRGKDTNVQTATRGRTSISDVIVFEIMSSCHMYVASQRIQEFLEAFFMFSKYKNAVLNGEQEKNPIICERRG